MHPDADELLYLLSGRIRVRLELEDGDRDVGQRRRSRGRSRGIWHQIYVDEPGELLNITPGPGGEARPFPDF